MEKSIRHEELLQNYLRKSDKVNSIKLLLELSIIRAKEKDFQAAEAFRDQIMEIDPMALTEIILSKEMIEEEKRKSMNKDYRELWGQLYNDLSIEEANALYFSLQNAVYGPGESIFTQGEHKSGLYFINAGRPKLIFSNSNSEVLIKVLGPGQIAGEETFLFDTVHTTSLITCSSVSVSFLHINLLNRWKLEFPMMEHKLKNFASKFYDTSDILKAKLLDRRIHTRIKVTGNGSIQIIDSNNVPISKPFQVGICDISRGGLCCLTTLTKKKVSKLIAWAEVDYQSCISSIKF